MREKTMKWKPYFSHLLQSRAALLQAITPQEKLKSVPLLQPDFFMAQSQAVPHTTASLNNVHQKMPLVQPHLHRVPAQSSAQTHITTPHSLPKVVSSPAQTEVTAAPSQVENQPGEHVASFQVDQHQLKFKDQEVSGAPAQVTTPNSQSQSPTDLDTLDAASSTTSTPKSHNPSPHPQKPVTLPLIRSKTGRIILPSSLKPSKLSYSLSRPTYTIKNFFYLNMLLCYY